mgnify:CR=1 FL=1|jgi:hypothetical protein
MVFHRTPFHGACNAWALAWLAMLGPKWMNKKRTTDKKATRVVGGTGIFGEVGGSLGLAWTHLGPLGLHWAHSDSSGFSWIRLDSLGLIWIHFVASLDITEFTGFTFGLDSFGSRVDSLYNFI